MPYSTLARLLAIAVAALFAMPVAVVPGVAGEIAAPSSDSCIFADQELAQAKTVLMENAGSGDYGSFTELRVETGSFARIFLAMTDVGEMRADGMIVLIGDKIVVSSIVEDDLVCRRAFMERSVYDAITDEIERWAI